ncbi:MAG: hypothetical protein Q8K79_01220 [Solirubrobacteraceae bacterium]|nr:hypothetical protein [Solirubrobacteraceae bacterium]
MLRRAAVVVVLCAGLVAGCGNTDVQPDLSQVERRVGTLVGDNEGGAAEARCTEASADRAYECEVSVNGLKSTYGARVSANGEKIELEQR